MLSTKQPDFEQRGVSFELLLGRVAQLLSRQFRTSIKTNRCTTVSILSITIYVPISAKLDSTFPRSLNQQI